MTTYQKVSIGAADILVDADTGALYVCFDGTITQTDLSSLVTAITNLQSAVQASLLAAGPCSKVKLSGTLIPASASTPQAFPAAPSGTKRMVISPLMGTTGSAANTSVCFLRENATNTAAGAPIRPTDGLANINTTDPTQFFLKVITQGDGVSFLYLGD